LDAGAGCQTVQGEVLTRNARYEVSGEKLAGIAVHVGARIVSQAAPGEILVSSTVKDLVAGSGLEFADRGDHTLKGVPGEWRLFAAT